MHPAKMVGKREFIQHTSKYLKWIEENDKELIITHQNKPEMVLTMLKKKSFKDMSGFAQIKVYGDINDHILPGYDEW